MHSRVARFVFLKNRVGHDVDLVFRALIRRCIWEHVTV